MKDIYIVGGDEDTCKGHMHPEPILIDIKIESIAKVAVDAMFWRIDNPDEAKVVRMVNPSLAI